MRREAPIAPALYVTPAAVLQTADVLQPFAWHPVCPPFRLPPVPHVR
jgi:hypothetical protein